MYSVLQNVFYHAASKSVGFKARLQRTLDIPGVWSFCCFWWIMNSKTNEMCPHCLNFDIEFGMCYIFVINVVSIPGASAKVLFAHIPFRASNQQTVIDQNTLLYSLLSWNGAANPFNRKQISRYWPCGMRPLRVPVIEISIGVLWCNWYFPDTLCCWPSCVTLQLITLN